jgi:hypothetical protein
MKKMMVLLIVAVIVCFAGFTLHAQFGKFTDKAKNVLDNVGDANKTSAPADKSGASSVHQNPDPGSALTRSIPCGDSTCDLCGGKYVPDHFINMEAKIKLQRKGNESSAKFAEQANKFIGAKFAKSKLRKDATAAGTHLKDSFCWQTLRPESFPIMKANGYEMGNRNDKICQPDHFCIEPVAHCQKLVGDSSFSCTLNLRRKQLENGQCPPSNLAECLN